MTTTTFMGIENVTVPAGTFSACKIKLVSGTTTSYYWLVASGTYRGLTARVVGSFEDGQEVDTVTTKFVLNGK